MTLAIPRALAVLLLLATSAVALAPREAFAHDRNAHESALPPDQWSEGVSGAALTPPCPRVPGRLCCCAGVVALPGGSTPPVVDCSRHATHAARAGAVPLSSAFRFHLASALYPDGRPRAPPLSS